jgi:hypothetical protein
MQAALDAVKESSAKAERASSEALTRKMDDMVPRREFDAKLLAIRKPSNAKPISASAKSISKSSSSKKGSNENRSPVLNFALLLAGCMTRPLRAGTSEDRQQCAINARAFHQRTKAAGKAGCYSATPVILRNRTFRT